MRPVTFILLVVLAFTVLAPVTVFTPVVMNDGHSFFGNLDVCHAATPALSSSGEMPCITPVSCNSAPTLFVSFIEPVHDISVEYIFASRNEQPPKS